MATSPEPTRIALVAFPGIRAFDVSVITEVWGVDRTDRGVPPFDLRRTAAEPSPIALRGGLSLTPDRTLAWLARADLIVVPGLDDHLTPAPAPVLEALRRAHARATPIASLCGGAFTLAQAGLLDGRRAVTHWNLTDLLSTRHPQVKVTQDALFLHEDNIWTSAGTAAGIDLCLHLVRATHGAETAATIARSMVTAPFRTGTQAQFIEHPTPAPTATRTPSPRYGPSPWPIWPNPTRSPTSPPAPECPPLLRPPLPGLHRHDPAALADHPTHRRSPEAPGTHRPPPPRGGPPHRLRQRDHHAPALRHPPLHQPPRLPPGLPAGPDPARG